MSTTKRKDVKHQSNKGMKKKSKRSSKDTGSKVVDNWRSEARALGKEKKYVDIVIQPLLSSNDAALGHIPAWSIPWNPVPGGVILCPNLIPQGNTIVTRKDDAIKLRSLYIQGMFRPNRNTNHTIGSAPSGLELIGNSAADIAASDVTVNPGMIRVLVVYDESPNGVQPASVDDLMNQILGTDSTTGKPQYLVKSTSGNVEVDLAGSNKYASDAFMNMRGQGRFRLLADERIPYGGFYTPAGAERPSQTFDMPCMVPYQRYLKLGGIATHFSKSEASIDVTSIQKGALYVIATFTHGSSYSSNPVFEGSIRLRFDD